jgi:hypothetical protein
LPTYTVSPEEAQDKLDPFKPLTGRRKVCIPEGTPIKKEILRVEKEYIKEREVILKH